MVRFIALLIVLLCGSVGISLGDDRVMVLVPGDGLGQKAISGCADFQSKTGMACDARYTAVNDLDPVRQVEFIESAIQSGARGLVIWPLRTGIVAEALARARSYGLKVVTVGNDAGQEARDAAVETDFELVGINMAMLFQQARPDGGKVCVISTTPIDQLPEPQKQIANGLKIGFGGQDGGGMFPQSSRWQGVDGCTGKPVSEAVYAARQEFQLAGVVSLDWELTLDPSGMTSLGDAVVVGPGYSYGQVLPDDEGLIRTSFEALDDLLKGQPFADGKVPPTCGPVCSSRGCSIANPNAAATKPCPCSKYGCSVVGP